MTPRITGHGTGGPPMPWRRHVAQGGLRGLVRAAAAAAAGGGGASYLQKVKGFHGPAKAALTSGCLSSTGDLVAQALTSYMSKAEGKAGPPYDASRTLRMFGFGVLYYGPLQYYWYSLLEHLMPTKTPITFLTKLLANQAILGSVTVAAVLSMNTALTRSMEAVPAKLHNDFWPTLQNGWKFWVPAASINFLAVPLSSQVLFMSCCGVLWTAYLSYASSTSQATAAAAPTKSCCAGKAK